MNKLQTKVHKILCDSYRETGEVPRVSKIASKLKVSRQAINQAEQALVHMGKMERPPRIIPT